MAQVVPLVVQKAQGAMHGWQVRSEVWPHFPEGQGSTQVFESRKKGLSQEVQVVAVVEQPLQDVSQVVQTVSPTLSKKLLSGQEEVQVLLTDQ